jgi:hypothetical protein
MKQGSARKEEQNMLHKKMRLLAALVLAAVLTGCGAAEEEEYHIQKDPAQSAQTQGPEQVQESAPQETASQTAEGPSGYVFEVQTGSGTISIGADQEMSAVLEQLGEPKSYFEAASCAFEGLDKMYTYDHFEIDTYPDGAADRISCIIFWDDMVSTPEGICIGSSFTDMTAAYGEGYLLENGFYLYEKDGSRLKFLVENDSVSSIQYESVKAASSGNQ